ncbi:MAG: ABC transporter ATP-binding protein [Syntrophobacterales bacterium]|jgi:lipopolysaccharide transport system ATP-binding protein
MSEIAISIENLSKQYRIGGEHQGYKTLRDTLAATFSAPLRGLSSVFGGKSTRSANDTIWALRDVSLQVKRGDVVGIIGRNGAGKTTLLKILSRITEPTEGYAEIHGRVGSLLEVGTGFHPELSGRENIFLNGAILGMRKTEIQGKFDEIVDFAEIDKFIDTPVKHYSSGMYVRLAFAVAAHLEPEILLVDEVLAVGDAAFQKKCLGKMGDVAKGGKTILFVSHNMMAVRSLCQRAIWLQNGVLIQKGGASNVVMKYLDEGRESVHEQVWDDAITAPGTDEVRIRRVFVRPALDKDMMVLSTTQDIEVGVEFWCLKPEQELAITLHVKTHDGIVVFSTSSAHNPSLRGSKLDRGLYRSRCQIPADLLNKNVYFIRLLVVKNQANVVFDREEALTFEVVDSGERRGAYFGERLGVVGPLLAWDMEKIDGSSR